MSTYTHGFHTAVLRSHSWRTAANSAAYLLPELKPGQDLPDVGCGPGTITADLALAVAPGRVAAVDSSAEVLEKARHAAAEAGVTGAVFEVADVHALPYPDDSFDVVHAHQVPAPETTCSNPAARAQERSIRPASGSPPLPRATRWYSAFQSSSSGTAGNQVKAA